MKHTRGRVVDVTTLDDLDRRLAGGARSLAGWRLVRLDLTDRADALLDRSVEEALFLGCTFADGDADAVQRAGGVVLPTIPDAPVDPYRASLYAPRELYDTPHYRDSLDARAYAWSQGHAGTDDQLAMDLHDHSVDVALAGWLRGHSVVGVMGGHSLERGSEQYAAAAHLGHGLGSALTVATGGGPGAMEAANLGAFLADEPAAAVDDALVRLATVPSFHHDIGAWARTAFEVLDAHPGHDSLGVPTWHYGHEPPNPFATAIAKYFRNATREAILLEVCDAGIVFLPGAAGTVQEVFQDACENYYGDPATIAPMVLVGVRHWTEDVPAWPLLQALARGRAMEPHIHLVDSLEEAVATIRLSRRDGGSQPGR